MKTLPTTAIKRAAVVSSAVATALLLSLATAIPVKAAGDLTLPATVTPADLKNGAGSTTIADGGVTNMQGTVAWTGAGSAGKVGEYTIRTWLTAFPDDGYVTDLGFVPGSIINVSNSTQRSFITVIDEGGLSVTVPVDVSGVETLAEAMGVTYFVGYKPSVGEPFYGASLANVTNGTLNFGVNTSGTIGDWGTRQTTYLSASASGGNTAEINWNTKALVVGDNSPNIALSSLDPQHKEWTVYQYAGDFTDSYGEAHSVTNLEEYETYLAYLAGRMTTKADYDSNYTSNVARALVASTVSATINPSGTYSIPPTDPLFWGNSGVVVMAANGANSTVRVTPGAGVSLIPSAGIVMKLTNGATGINQGTILMGWGADAGTESHAVYADGGSHFRNEGRMVYSSISSRWALWDRITDSLNAADDPISSDYVTGAGSVYENTGVMDVFAFSTTYRNLGNSMLYVGDSASFINSGAVNLGVNPTENSDVYGATLVSNNATIHNTVDGVMYMGREGSLGVTGPSIDRGGADVLIGNGGFLIGTWTTLNTANILNEGQLIIGSKVQNATAIKVQTQAAGSIDVENKGTIQIKGNLVNAHAQNLGIHIIGDSSNGRVVNSGTINLEGVNAVAMKAESGAHVTSSGEININNGENVSPGLFNYGMWIEGANSKGTLSGAVNLQGDGSVGLYAKGGATIDITGAGAVNFLSGKKQIGFYVFGVGSSINTNTNEMTIVSKDSTLFRIADGATFEGGTYTLNIGGDGSTALMLTGLTSTTTTGNMTMNLTGSNAVGILVEGGATATVSNGTVIEQSGVGSVAGIADGQKHALDGSVQDISNVTKLTAGAELNSALNNVTGYIARNTATLENTGEINFTGTNATGIRVEEGAIGINSGDITVDAGGVALVAQAATVATLIQNTGTLTLNGGDLDHRTVGIRASGKATKAEMTAGEILMNGVGAIGVEALNGAWVDLDEDALPVFGETDQIAFRISGAGSKVTHNAAANKVFDASTDRSAVYSVEGGATMTGTHFIVASGEDSRGIVATGNGTQVTIKSNSEFDLSGDGSWGVYATGGAKVTIESNVAFDTAGEDTQAVVVDGNAYDAHGNVTATNRGTVVTNNNKLEYDKDGAIGYIVRNSGTLINDQGGGVIFSSTNNIGVQVQNASFTNQNGIVDVDGIAVDVTGGQSKVTNVSGTIIARDGVATIRISDGANLTLGGNNNGLGVITAKGSAHGVLVDTGAAGLTVNGARIDVNDVDGTGNGIENAANISGIQLLNTTINVLDGVGVRTARSLAATNSGTINVDGSGVGIYYADTDGSEAFEDFDLSNSFGLTINANGADSRGIVVNASGTVKSAVNVNVAATGSSALVIENSPATVIQSGSLASLSTAAVVDVGTATSFENRGTINAVTTDDIAVTFDTVTDSTFINTGTVSGVVAMNGGDNTVILNAGSKVTKVVTDDGDNTFTSKGNQAFGEVVAGSGTSDRLVFDGATHVVTDASEITGFEYVDVNNGSLVTLRTDLVLGNTADYIGEVSIGATGTIAVNPSTSEDFVFNNKLLGTGILDVVMQDAADTFNFASTTGTNFAGTLRLGQSTFELGGDNTAALTNATLEVGTDNHTTVATGTHAIGGLTINGGRIDFTATIPADDPSPAVIAASGTIHLISGTVGVKLPVADAPPSVNPQAPLLRQSSSALVQLASSEATVGAPTSVTLVDINTNDEIDDPTMININQGGELVASGTYNYGLTTTNPDNGDEGLYIAYKLTAVDIYADKTLTLDQDKPGFDRFEAVISGSGNLAVAATNAITLNAVNTYTGTTYVKSGTLIAGVSNALGDTSNLTIDSGAAFKLNGVTQSIGTISTAANSRLTLDAGVLTIENGGTSNGTLSGDGTLNVAGGKLVVNGANTNLVANVVISASAIARLGDAVALGNSGTVTVAQQGTLELAPTANGTFAKTLEGAGDLVKDGSATVTIGRANTGFTGTTYVKAGTLSATNLGAVGATQIITSQGGSFELNSITSGTFANTVSGSGALAITNSKVAISGSNSMTTANLKGSTVTMASDYALGKGNAANIVNLDQTSTIWIATAAAKLGTVNLGGGSLGFIASGSGTPVYRSAEVAALGGSSGTLIFNVDFDNAVGLYGPGVRSDYLKIGNDGMGKHQVHINAVNDGIPQAEETAFELISADIANATYVLDAPNGRMDFALSTFEMLKGDGTSVMPKANSWYLADVGLSRAADAIMNTASLQGMDWAYSLDSLYLRMGEVRAENIGNDNPTGNVWVRGRGYRLNASNQLSGTSFHQYTYGVTAGGDKAFATKGGTSLVGGFIDMGKVDRDFDNYGKGETNNVGVGIYYTMLCDQGWFVDLIGKLDRSQHEFDAVAIDGKVTSGRYTNKSQGLSAEVGRRLQRNDGWWIEPTLQASVVWINGASYDTTPDRRKLRVTIDDVMSAQYRAQIRFGRQLFDSRWYPYGKIAAAMVDTDGGEIKAHNRHFEADYDGKRIEAGFGTAYRINPISQVYFDYEYAKASEYERPWSVNLGYRRLW